MDENMLQQMTARFPGISCAWADADGAVCTDCTGQADRERGIPVDAHTIFPACSVSKFITALCVLRLHDQGLLNVDMPVNSYLQQWKLRTPDGLESAAPIRTLLNHTAGIVDGEDGFYGFRRGDPPVSLMDILEGRTAYNNRPVRAEQPHGTSFAYADAGYCVLQLLVETVTGADFAQAARRLVFDELHLEGTFFASPENIAHYENTRTMAAGYDGDGQLLPGKYPCQPDLAASGLWTTPTELLRLAQAFLDALNGRGSLLQQTSAQTIAAPVKDFPWTGLGVFTAGADVLMSQGWGENGQCMLKMNVRTGCISAVMTNRNPEVDQEASGVAWLVDQRLTAAD